MDHDGSNLSDHDRPSVTMRDATDVILSSCGNLNEHSTTSQRHVQTYIIELDDGIICRKPVYLMVKTMVSYRFSVSIAFLILGRWQVHGTWALWFQRQDHRKGYGRRAGPFKGGCFWKPWVWQTANSKQKLILCALHVAYDLCSDLLFSFCMCFAFFFCLFVLLCALRCFFISARVMDIISLIIYIYILYIYIIYIIYIYILYIYYIYIRFYTFIL